MNAKELQSLFDRYGLGTLELVKQKGSDYVEIIAKDHPDDIRVNYFGSIPEMEEIVWEDYEINDIFFCSDAWAHPVKNADDGTGKVGSEFGIFLSNDDACLSEDVTVSRVEAAIQAVKDPLSYQTYLLGMFLNEMKMVKLVFEPLFSQHGIVLQYNNLFCRGGSLGYESELYIVYNHPEALPGSSIIFAQDICTGHLYYLDMVETSPDDWRGAMGIDGRRLRLRQRYLNSMTKAEILEVIEKYKKENCS